MKDEHVFIGHILEAITKIQKYIGGIANFEQFEENDMLFDAVVREFEIIGEASVNISEQFRTEHPGVLWGEMIGMRNKLIHEYFGVDRKVVWDTCLDDLPRLVDSIKSILLP